MQVKKVLNSRIFPLLMINFIGALGMSIVIPFLVFLVEDFGGNGLIYGLMGATYPLFQFLFGPVLGMWSDRWGRKRVLLLSQAGTLISWTIFLIGLLSPVTVLTTFEGSVFGAFTLTVPLLLLFAARAMDGLTGGNVTVANAYLADISDDDNRQRNFGWMSAAANLGFILGPAMAGLLAGGPQRGMYPAIAAIAISLLGLLLIIFVLPESTQEGEGEEEKEDYQVKDILQIKGIPYLIILYFLIFLGFNFFYTAFPVHAQKSLEWNEAQLGFYLSGLSLLMLLVQGPGLSYIGGRFRDAGLVVAGAGFLALNFYLIMSGEAIPTLLALLFFAAGNGVMWPSFMSILAKAGKKSQQGAIQGLAGSGGSLASIIGLVSGGFLYTLIGPWTFGVAGTILLLVALLSLRILNKN